MKLKISISLLLITAGLFNAACNSAATASNEKEIKSTKTDHLTITLASATGQLKNGENDLTLIFTDKSGKPVDVGSASLNFNMAAMGAMAEMNDKARLTTTDTLGKYKAKVSIEMVGTWEAQVKYQGAHGTGQVSMTVQAK